MEKRGCQSIVLSGGYEDDTDYGDSFLYTGSGGKLDRSLLVLTLF